MAKTQGKNDFEKKKKTFCVEISISCRSDLANKKKKNLSYTLKKIVDYNQSISSSEFQSSLK